MRKKNFLLVIFAMLCTSMMAQDAIHGVDGYYNFTPNQIQSAGIMTIGNNGKKLKGWYPSVGYTDDMKYAVLHMGVNSTTYAAETGGWPFRSELLLTDNGTKAGIMTITNAYPVLAFKISMPLNDQSTAKSLTGTFEPEFSWYNPNSTDGTNPGQTSGNKYKVQLSGLDNNGRYRFAFFSPVLKDSLGRDSIKLGNSGNAGYSTYRIATAVNKNDTIWHIVRINPEKKDTADFLFALDLSKVGGSGVSMLDTTNVKMKSISLSFLGCNADTFKVVGTDTIAKTAFELPTVYLKWMKTFSSMKAFDASLTEANNWGDGAAVDPFKDELNSTLYALKLMMANYSFSDQLTILKTAYDNATTVYNNAASVTDDYKTQLTAIATAKSKFLSTIVYAKTSLMNKFLSLTGMALGLSSNQVTVGGLTGKSLTMVSAENATKFLVTDSGSIDGQKCYLLSTADGTLAQASDGTLVLIDPTQQTSSNVAKVILSNRGTTDNPGYDFKVGAYYYYYNEESGELMATKAIPTVSTYDEMSDYLFYPQSAEDYDKTDHDATNYPMSAGENSLFEFNGTIDNHLEPAYETSFAKYPWDEATKAVATTRATLPYAEGWSTNGWRMSTKVDMTTLSTGEKVMKLNVMDTYDYIHSDSVNVDTRTTDWTSSQAISIMREHGVYTSALNKVPQPNQVCDSLYAINLNSGINRYFAMKWKGNSSSITFGGLAFYVRKNIGGANVSTSNLLQVRGDVYIWDLLQAGVPYGDSKACAQYLSWDGCQSSSDIVYVDWMRFYDSLDAIPTEKMDVPTAISNVNADSKAVIAVNGQQVQAVGTGTVYVYDIAGELINKKESNGEVFFNMNKGLYLIKLGTNIQKVLIK